MISMPVRMPSSPSAASLRCWNCSRPAIARSARADFRSAAHRNRATWARCARLTHFRPCLRRPAFSFLIGQEKSVSGQHDDAWPADRFERGFESFFVGVHNRLAMHITGQTWLDGSGFGGGAGKPADFGQCRGLLAATTSQVFSFPRLASSLDGSTPRSFASAKRVSFRPRS